MHDESFGSVRGDAPDEDGELVRDDELLSSQPDASRRPELRTGGHVSQRVRRRSLTGLDVPSLLVGRYQVERVVTRTAHEIVVQAVHLELSQRVLVRYLTPEASISPEAVARFQRGARKAREMRSEHAERVVDFGRLESGSPYRATELPSGPSLAEILRVRGSLPVMEAVDIILAACEPVAEAHAAGIVHRSLCTSNIYVERRPDGSPLVRVLDFGVSDPLEPEWGNGEEPTRFAPVSMSNSLPYTAPEQVRSPGTIDARIDVWALGAILYELLAGEPVFQGENALSLLAMISADTPTPLNMLRGEILPELESIVLACLQKDPDSRPRSSVDLVVMLSHFGSPDAQSAAARVTRIITRATRPPPLPMMSQGPSVSRRPSALVRQRQPRPSQAVEPERFAAAAGRTQGFGMLFAGAGIGIAAAIVTAIITRPAPIAAPAPEAARAAIAASPAVAAPAAAPVVVPVTTATPVLAPTAITPVAAPPPVAVAVAPTPPQSPAVAAPISQPVRPAPVQRSSPAVSRSSVAAPAATNASSRAGEQKPTVTADAKDLFGGLD